MNSEERAGMPRWLKLALLAGVIAAGLVVVVLLMSGAHKIPSHGPSGGDTSSSVHVPPPHGQ